MQQEYRSSEFVCQQCKTIVPLPRMFREREPGHIKDLWCPSCRMVTKHREYRLDRFDRDKERFARVNTKRKVAHA